MKANPLLQLKDLGQSLWLDYIRRGIIVSGELSKLIQEDGLCGVTSNPTIFEKAISGSKDYDEAMKLLVEQGKSVQEIYESLVLEDIGRAADLFRSVYEESHGVDGYVSIEVSPGLAYDTLGTIKEARRLFALLDRSNIMIKVPGTPEGIPAVETLISEGINVNITLLFDTGDYGQVMEAYLKGLEKRMERGQSLDSVASVASFFVSRVDTAADKRIGEKIQDPIDAKEKEKRGKLMGKIAVANARIAYQQFKEVFFSSRFERLREQGAKPQRPLWASTSTKNPAYSDILYVQNLIGKQTVNTVPPETLQAFRDHGEPRLTIEEKLEEAKQDLRELEEIGIDLKQITKTLQEDGVRAFSDSFQKLMHCISVKREAFLGGLLDRQTATLGSTGGKVQVTLETFAKADFVKRLWSKDVTIWKKTAEVEKSIKNRLGWLTVVDVMKDQTDRMLTLAGTIAQDGFEDVVLLGMGGSSLCPDVLQSAFGKTKGYPSLHVLDSTDPQTILDVERKIDPAKTLFVVSSKSGGTTETISLFEYFYEIIPEGKNFIAITDPGTSLEETALKREFRQVFLNPSDIGGRYSALSYFGLVPAALAGIDIQKILDAAERMVQSCVPWIPSLDNPGAILGTILGEMYKSGRDKITFIIPPPIHAFGYWVEQLLAESTGKEGKGLVPVEGEPVGEPGVYGKDRLFVYIHLRNQHDEKWNKKVKALEDTGHPVMRITLENQYDLGEEFFRWELATAIAGSIMGINPFDEPNVQESKDNTRALLEVFKKEGKLPEEKPLMEENGLKIFAGSEWLKSAKGKNFPGFLSHFFESARQGDYISLMSYSQHTSGNEQKFQEIRSRLRDGLRVATTLGYGPRFLHSTGQLHKGGANNGIFLQFTAEESLELGIPGETFGFNTLKQAQALGDYQALQRHGRRVVRIHCVKEKEKTLQGFVNLLEEVVSVKK